jgi:hypothetical protein
MQIWAKESVTVADITKPTQPYIYGIKRSKTMGFKVTKSYELETDGLPLSVRTNDENAVMIKQDSDIVLVQPENVPDLIAVLTDMQEDF